ncbi:MAG: Blp family class II bacteriocin [Lagierella massiliensis]|nr:Blp family class II bacteriocin [Lagierella massiliensis]
MQLEKFECLDSKELELVEGGIGFLAACAAVAGVGAALSVCYKAGVAVGKAIYNYKNN